MFAQAGQIFRDQVTTDSLAQNIVYASGTVGALVIFAGLLLVDIGGVRRVNVFDTVIQKVIGFFIGFVVYFLIGFAIWNWQYYVAFDVPNPYWQAIEDWWLGGSLSGAFAQDTNPDGMGANLNNQQIFIFFLACFAGIINVLIHLAVTERIKAAAYYAISFVAAIVSSVLSWLTWGSTGPLTNAGYHDFFGAGFVYVFAGAVALVLVRRLGERPGMFRPHALVGEYRSYNLGLTAIGLVFIIGGLPFVILSCGFFFDPQALFVGVNMTDTGIGVAFNNLGLAWAGGALTGALIAYRTKKYIYTLLGPFAGYVAGSPAFDIYAPWEMLLVSLAAPFVAYAVYEWLQRREIDEHKLIPLFIGVASYGILIAGVLNWGTPQGGYFGVTEGDYAFQNAEINLLWQAIGLAVCLAAGLLTGWVMSFVLERTTGLGVSEDVQVAGYDAREWEVVHDLEPAPAAAAVAGQPAAVTRADGEPAPTDVRTGP
ncbi:MAG: ammonium transporter [Thermoleophilaceae bacterium]|nr:ammonium transporter [Thermoleophilaceae bacterium]